MLKSLELRNFRGFREHRVDFSPFSLLIGQNNAGKTTVIEALRIVALAQARAVTGSFSMAPDEFSSVVTGAVFRVSLATIGFEHETVHHQNDTDSPAVITARLSNRCSITVVIGKEPSDVFCQLQEPGGKKIHNRSLAANPKFGRIIVMPPIGHVLEHETPISAAYMVKNLVGFRAHRHIRNQLFEKPQEYDIFKRLIEESWSQLQIGPVTLIQTEKGPEYALSVRDGPFVTELGRQGSGLQAWFQTLWFLARNPKKSIVVLDEPDVYLHADLQRKLLKIVGGLAFKQSIIATHSIEMISDVSHQEVVFIRKRERVSRPLASNDEAQGAIEQLGTIHNIQLSKIAISGSLLFLEGKDKSFLSELAYKLGSKVFDRFISVPSFPIGGLDNWKRAALSAKTFHQTSNGRIKCYLILDRDYRTDEEIDRISKEALKDELIVIFWRKKEIENYLFCPKAIARVISDNGDFQVWDAEIEDTVSPALATLEDGLEGQFAESVRSVNRKIDIPTALLQAKTALAARRAAGATARDLVSGKELLGQASAACQAKFHQSFSPMAVCRAMRESEIDPEVVQNIRLVCGM